jgi:DNA polymerase-3 subunit epsilon
MVNQLEDARSRLFRATEFLTEDTWTEDGIMSSLIWFKHAEEHAVLGLDTETTGTDTETDRIVTISLVLVSASRGLLWEATWLVNPGIEIPAAATAVHGITTQQAAADGTSPDVALDAVLGLLYAAEHNEMLAQLPLVVFNSPFDLGLLDAESRRHCGLGWEMPQRGRILDPLVLDKHLDPYRRGKRTLTAQAEHYGIELVDAHSSAADAAASCQIALQQLRDPGLATLTPVQLHERQITWAAAQRSSFAGWLRRQGRPEDAAEVLSRGWPL